MKTVKEILDESKKKNHHHKKVHKFFAHFKSGSDPKHSIEDEKKEPKTFFAHFKSGKDKKHDIKEDDENHKYQSLHRQEDGFDKQFSTTDTSGIRHHKEIKISPEENYSIIHYTASSSYLNNMLHKHGEESVNRDQYMKKHMDGLDKVTRNPENALTHPLETHSGLSTHFGEMLHKVKTGEHVHSPAYISSTTNHPFAHDWARLSDEPDANHGLHTKHVAVFKLPAGYSKARSVAHLSQHINERELLHARDQKYEKTGSYMKSVTNPTTNFTHVVYYHHLKPVDD